MSLRLFAHPFSSYCQKVLIALYENATAFEYVMLDSEAAMGELERVWPFRKFPVLLDGDCAVRESSIIIEYLDLYHPGAARMLPEDPRAALDVRFKDRFFDNYIMTPTQKLVGDALRPEAQRDAYGLDEARRMLSTAYAWLDNQLAQQPWVAGEEFSMADCAAAPSLFYADWVYPIANEFTNLKAYRMRLLARASVARAVDEARPYRPLFPLGAPDRD